MSEFDLYEFPSDYTGRKTYVSVKGHSKSVPCIYVGPGADGRRHVLPEFGGDPQNFSVANSAPSVMRDIGEYKSPLDGSMITSRSAHRNHMRQHGVIEVGTQKLGTMGSADRAPMTRAGYDIARAMRGN